MKISYLLFLVLFISSLVRVNAQQEYFEYGFKGGINLTNINGDVPSGYEARTSMNIGAYGLYKILPKLGIQAELLYSEQGYSNDFIPEDVTIEKIEEILRMQYINLPVLGSYNVIENLWIEGGVQAGYLVEAELERERVTTRETGQVNSRTETVGRKNNYKDLDLGVAGGLRYKLNPNFMVQARYTQSLNDINEVDPGDQYNSIFSFSVGFVF